MQNIGAGSMQWRCGVCNSASSVGSGGICKRCKKFACNRHLETVLLDGNQKLKVCSACLKADDKVEQGLLGGLKKLFRWP